jgi:hypothetical protein
MEIKNLTNKYTLTKQGEDYHLDLGVFVSGENTETLLSVSGIDSNNFVVNATCGCTATNLSVVDDNTVNILVSYHQCEASFMKTVELIEARKITYLKIKGECRT